MKVSVFALIAGIASLLGFGLQLRDAFPRHREVRKAVLFVTIGVFIGTLVGSLQGLSVIVNVPYAGVSLYLLIAVALLCCLALVAILKNDRNALTGLVLLLLWAIIALALSGLLTLSTQKSGARYTTDEILQLVEDNVKRGNIDRAVALLENVKETLPAKDSRHDLIDERIDRLKQEQVSHSAGEDGNEP